MYHANCTIEGSILVPIAISGTLGYLEKRARRVCTRREKKDGNVDGLEAINPISRSNETANLTHSHIPSNGNALLSPLSPLGNRSSSSSSFLFFFFFTRFPSSRRPCRANCPTFFLSSREKFSREGRGKGRDRGGKVGIRKGGRLRRVRVFRGSRKRRMQRVMMIIATLCVDEDDDDDRRV